MDLSGAMATNIRYLERAGIRRSRAATSGGGGGVNAAAGGIVHVALLLTVVPIAGLHASIHLASAPDLSDYWPIAVAILIALSLAGLWYWRHGLRAIVDRIRPHTRDIRGVLAEPRRTLLLFGGSLGVTTAQAFVFIACLESVSVHLPILTMVAGFLACSALAAAAPTPGGLGGAGRWPRASRRDCGTRRRRRADVTHHRLVAPRPPGMARIQYSNPRRHTLTLLVARRPDHQECSTRTVVYRRAERAVVNSSLSTERAPRTKSRLVGVDPHGSALHVHASEGGFVSEGASTPAWGGSVYLVPGQGRGVHWCGDRRGRRPVVGEFAVTGRVAASARTA